MTDTDDIAAAAKAFGRLGGQSKSQRKQEASRRNAAKARAAAKARREAAQPKEDEE